jgi:hypothetical protein
VFVELVSLEPGKNPGMGELALKVRFEARTVVDGMVEGAAIVVTSLAADVARLVNKNTWKTEKNLCISSVGGRMGS